MNHHMEESKEQRLKNTYICRDSKVCWRKRNVRIATESLKSNEVELPRAQSSIVGSSCLMTGSRLENFAEKSYSTGY